MKENDIHVITKEIIKLSDENYNTNTKSEKYLGKIFILNKKDPTTCLKIGCDVCYFYKYLYYIGFCPHFYDEKSCTAGTKLYYYSEITDLL